MTDLASNKAVTSSEIVNPTPDTLLPGASSSDQSKPDYGLDESSVIEKQDGSTTTVGQNLADVDALKKKTVDLSDDGSKYTGDVTGANVTVNGSTDTVGHAFAGVSEGLGGLVTKTQNLSEDGGKFTGDVTGATGGVVAQPSPAQLTAAPTETDFNGLLTLLKTAGVLT